MIQKEDLLPKRESYLSLEGNKDDVQDFFFIAPKSDDNTLFFVTADRLSYKNSHLLGNNIASVFFLPNEKTFDTLFLENEKELSSYAPLLTQSLKKNHYRTNPSSLPMRLLLLHTKRGSAIALEFLRRASLGFAPFTFVLLGASFGIQLSRRKKEKMMQAFLLCSLLLLSYLVGKQTKAVPLCSAFLFIFPHLLIFFVACRRLYHLARGKI